MNKTSDVGKSGYFPSDYVEQIAAQQQMPNMMSQAPQQNHMQMGLNPVMQTTMMGAAPFQQNAPMMGAGPVQQMHGASATSNLSNVLRARVLFNFSADGPNQMKLTAGDIIEVLSRGAPGGWCRGASGAFPTDYVEILSGTGMQTNAPLLTAPNILLNSASLGSTMNTNSDLRQLPVNSFAGGQPSIFNQSKSTDDSGKMRIDLMSSGAGRYGGQSIGTATTSAPTTPVGSLLDMDLDAGVIHKSNSMSQSKVEELDIFGIDNSAFNAVPSMTSLLDLDAPIDLLPALRPDAKNKSLLDIPMPVMNAIKGNQMNADLSLEGFMSSSRPPLGSLLPERSPSTDTFQKTTSSAMMYNSSNLNMSSFDRLDIFSDSTSSTVMASSSTSAIMNGFQSQDVMDLRSLSLASSVSGSVTSSHNDGVRKSDVKPPPVTARVVPPTLYARAIYSREGDGPTELSLECGDFILVDTKEGEWWSGSKVASIGAGENTKGKIGYFPGNYVELVEGDVVTAALHSTPPSSVHGFSDDSNPFGSLMKMTSSARKIALRGTNAAQAIFLPDTDDLSGMAKSAPIVKLSSTFVCSLSIGENIPIWRHPAFADFYVDFHVPHPTPPPVVESKNIVITNYAVKKMSVALRLVCMALQRAREVFINAKNRISSAEEVKNEFLSQVLLHNISVFNEGSKLCDKLPAGTGEVKLHHTHCYVITDRSLRCCNFVHFDSFFHLFFFFTRRP